MNKVSCYTIAVLSVLLVININQVAIYQVFFPRLAWAAETLHLNILHARGSWKACKRFRYCDEYRQVPEWPIVWHGEVRWLA